VAELTGSRARRSQVTRLTIRSFIPHSGAFKHHLDVEADADLTISSMLKSRPSGAAAEARFGNPRRIEALHQRTRSSCLLPWWNPLSLVCCS